MTVTGHVENGQIVLDRGMILPEGVKVEITPMNSEVPAEEDKIPSLSERMKDFVGTAKNLPPDASQNIDHYLYGQPKK